MLKSMVECSSSSSDQNEEESKNENLVNDKLAEFSAEHDRELQADLDRITQKYTTQIQTFEKKGTNALTKKLIERAQNEMAKALDNRREEAF